VGCYIWYSEGPGRAVAPPSPLLAVPNVTAHPSTANVPTSYYLMWLRKDSVDNVDLFTVIVDATPKSQEGLLFTVYEAAPQNDADTAA